MTAQGWRKRQISNQVDADCWGSAGCEPLKARLAILEEENIDLKALLMHTHYYVTHFGTTNTITDREKQGKAAILALINTYLTDPMKKAPTGL